MAGQIVNGKLVGQYYDGTTWKKDLQEVDLVHRWTKEKVSLYWVMIGEEKTPHPLETIQVSKEDLLIDFVGHKPFVTSISLEDYLKFYHGYIVKK